MFGFGDDPPPAKRPHVDPDGNRKRLLVERHAVGGADVLRCFTPVT
jgi:hypothetical protein